MCVASLTLILTRSVGTLQPTRSSGRVGSKFNWPSEDQCHRSHSNGFLFLSQTYKVNTANYSSQNCLESRRSVIDDHHGGSLFWCTLSNDSRRGSAGIDLSQSRCCEFFVSLIDKNHVLTKNAITSVSQLSNRLYPNTELARSCTRLYGKAQDDFVVPNSVCHLPKRKSYQYIRNTVWLRDTVKQTSLIKSAAAESTACQASPSETRGPKVRPFFQYPKDWTWPIKSQNKKMDLFHN